LIEAKVYNIEPSRIFPLQASVLNIEFYSGKNLFFPFPAVIINHKNEHFNNYVHSYNRILNDVEEEIEINNQNFVESAIDVINSGDKESFFIFSSGFQEVDSELEFSLYYQNETLRVSRKIKLPRMTYKKYTLRSIFPQLNNKNVSSGILKIKQPKQFMFFGRMLVGIETPGAFFANHSYYVSSEVSEYWENNNPSFRQYPFLQTYKNLIRFYPIMSPSNLAIFFEFHAENEETIRSREFNLISPSERYLEINVNDIVKELGLNSSSLSSFVVKCSNLSGYTPTRINHQLVYELKDGLATSINMSLVSDNIYVSNSKKGLNWGQLVIGNNYDSILAVTLNKPSDLVENFKITFYDQIGKLGEMDGNFKGFSAKVINSIEIIEKFTRPQDGSYIWYVLESENPHVYSYSICRNMVTNHTSGEHCF